MEKAPGLTAPRSSAPAWPSDVSSKVRPAAAPKGPQSLVLDRSQTNTIPAARQTEPVTPNFVAASAEERGLASWYGEDFHGNPTANGETFDMNAMTAAHRTLPLPSLVQVINEANGKEIVVRVNDRGPFKDDRVIDLSRKAAQTLDILSAGTAPVTVKYLGPAPEAEEQPLTFAELDEPAPRIVKAEPQLVEQQDRDLYGDFLMGGVEPTLGVPDPGQSIATPARLANATPPAQRDLVPAGVQQASLPPLQPAPVQTRPEPIRAAATPAAAPQPTANAFAPKIYVQIGAFADISNAEGMNAQVGRQYPVDIEPVRVQGADYFRVLVGPFQSRNAADLAKYQLGVRGIEDGFIVLR
ncbi:MAG: septal ring lytic transglycosylase RlpA family protein [Henriciella sp.]|uniref:septal ring lytic transglycosylase RlpA family protein n=1 Tax=Henriciella sp. TaxID=1968823 RepID=UPI003C72AC3E